MKFEYSVISLKINYLYNFILSLYRLLLCLNFDLWNVRIKLMIFSLIHFLYVSIQLGKVLFVMLILVPVYLISVFLAYLFVIFINLLQIFEFFIFMSFSLVLLMPPISLKVILFNILIQNLSIS